jgi:hypothetical protein
MSSFQLEPAAMWTAAALLLGVQAAATAGRALTAREAISASREPLWLPPCEWVNLASIVYSVFGVFVLPVLFKSLAVMETAFCVYIILYGGYPMAVLAHQDGFVRPTTPGCAYCTEQERNMIVGLCGVVFVYLAAAVTLAKEDTIVPVATVAFVTVPLDVIVAVLVWRNFDPEEIPFSRGPTRYISVVGTGNGERISPGRRSPGRRSPSPQRGPRDPLSL